MTALFFYVRVNCNHKESRAMKIVNYLSRVKHVDRDTKKISYTYFMTSIEERWSCNPLYIGRLINDHKDTLPNCKGWAYELCAVWRDGLQASLNATNEILKLENLITSVKREHETLRKNLTNAIKITSTENVNVRYY